MKSWKLIDPVWLTSMMSNSSLVSLSVMVMWLFSSTRFRSDNIKPSDVEPDWRRRRLNALMSVAEVGTWRIILFMIFCRMDPNFRLLALWRRLLLGLRPWFADAAREPNERTDTA